VVFWNGGSEADLTQRRMVELAKDLDGRQAVSAVLAEMPLVRQVLLFQLLTPCRSFC
jgi:hypothetical protein